MSPVKSKERRDLGAISAQLQAFEDVATDILGRLDLEATLLSIVNSAARLVDADIAGILLADADGEVLRMSACTGHHTVSTAHLEVRRGQGVAGRIFETGEPLRVDDYLSDPSISHDFFGIVKEEGKRSALGAPMIVQGEVIGTLMVWRRRPSVFTDVHGGAITRLANLATIAIMNARLYEKEHHAVSRLEEANRRLEDQNEILQRSSNVHDELTDLVLEGKGIADLVPTVAKHTNGEVASLDPNLDVLAMSPGADVLVERARGHLLDARGRGEAAAQGTSVLGPDRSCASWVVFRSVTAGGDRQGYLCVGLDHSPIDLDLVIVEQAAIVCALELTKERAILEARTRVRTDFLWDLFEGNISDDGEARLRARYLRYTLPETLRVMIIQIEGLTGWLRAAGGAADAVDRQRESLVRTAEDLATMAGPSASFAARRGSIIALAFPSSDDLAKARALADVVLGGLRDAYPGLGFSAGVSSCVELTANLQPAHSQAQNALSAVPLLGSGPPVAIYDDLGVLRFLLAPGDRSELSRFARNVLGPVVDHDRSHGAELIRTVDAYLANDCELKRTAECLYVHPKTVRYRLDRVQDLSGVDLSGQQGRFDAKLAISIIQALSLDDEDP